jgi:hypothetical protein
MCQPVHVVKVLFPNENSGRANAKSRGAEHVS